MKKVKKSLTVILVTFISVIGALLLISTLDYIINFKTNSEIDKFFTKMNTLEKNDMCMKNFGYDSASKMSKIPPPPKNSKLTYKPKRYSKAIISCSLYRDDVAVLEIPKNIPEDKQVLLKKYKKLNIEIAGLLIDKLNKYKDYNCYIKEKDLRATLLLQAYSMIADMKLTEIQARKKISFEYYFVYVPKKHQLENQLKMITEMQKSLATASKNSQESIQKN